MNGAGRLLGLCLLMGMVGCGHSVTPRGGFDDPANIPLPEDLGVFPSRGGVSVTWFSEPEIFAVIDGWNLYRARGVGEPTDADYQLQNRDLLVEDAFLDDDVVDGETYWYRMTSVTPAGIESLPTERVRTLVDFTPPPPPLNLEGEAEENPGGGWIIRLRWDPVADPTLRHYNLLRDPPDPLLPVISGLLSPDFIDTRVEAGSTYVYVATSVDDNLNESGPSDPVTVTVPR